MMHQMKTEQLKYFMITMNKTFRHVSHSRDLFPEIAYNYRGSTERQAAAFLCVNKNILQTLSGGICGCSKIYKLRAASEGSSRWFSSSPIEQRCKRKEGENKISYLI